MSDDTLYLKMKDAAFLLGISYQTLINNKDRFRAFQIDAPGRSEYAVAETEVRQRLLKEIESAQARLRLLDSGEFEDVRIASGVGVELSDRENEMIRLRYEEYWTLREIGELFGVTRERVRQIVGNSGNVAKKRIRKAIKENPRKTNGEIAKMLDLHPSSVSTHREVRAPIKGDSSTARGYKWESFAKNDLESRGFHCTRVHTHEEYDLLVNDNIRVDVKSNEAPNTPPSLKGRTKSPRWHFSIRNLSHSRSDFLYCVTGEEDVFIIPVELIPEGQTDLIFCYPTMRPKIGKYQKFHERYDLLCESEPQLNGS